jgi:hypothetical protein
MAGLLVVGLAANLLVRPVDAKYHLRPPGDAPSQPPTQSP